MHLGSMFGSPNEDACWKRTPVLEEAHAFAGEHESEAVYIHVLRMIALAVDNDYQNFCRVLAKAHRGDVRTAPIKGMTRMWNKLLSRNDHRFLPQELLDDGKRKRSGQNMSVFFSFHLAHLFVYPLSLLSRDT